MVVIASAEMIADLEQAIQASSGRSVHLPGSVRNFFDATADRLPHHQLGFFDEMPMRLAGRVGLKSPAQLGDGLDEPPLGGPDQQRQPETKMHLAAAGRSLGGSAARRITREGSVREFAPHLQAVGNPSMAEAS